MYLKPALLAATARLSGRKLAPSDLDESYLRSIIRFRDTGTFAILGDCVTALGDRALIDLAYEGILSYQDRCGHWGLLGLRWMGPVARSLGILAAAQGRGEAADEHFAAAVDIARRMDARPWVARIVLEWIENLQRIGAVTQRALALLDEAHTTAGELGLTSLADRLAQCREAAASAEPTAPAATVAGLPAVEYFRLVAGRRSVGL